MAGRPDPVAYATAMSLRGRRALRSATAVLPRLAALPAALSDALRRVDALLSEAEACLAHISAVVQRVDDCERAARCVIEDASDLTLRAGGALDAYEPGLRDLQPVVQRMAQRVGPAQVDAIVAYLDFLPMLQRLDDELVPMLSAMKTVAPDLTELLAVSRGLNELMGSLPGLGRAKRRVDEQIEGRDDDAG